MCKSACIWYYMHKYGNIAHKRFDLLEPSIHFMQYPYSYLKSTNIKAPPARNGGNVPLAPLFEVPV